MSDTHPRSWCREGGHRQRAATWVPSRRRVPHIPQDWLAGFRVDTHGGSVLQHCDLSQVGARGKFAGSNNGETQALAFADESLWLVWLAWSEMHGASMRRWQLDETVRQVDGMLITDSRGRFDALTRSESHSFDCEALDQVKRHVESRNSVPFSMLAFTWSIPQRCWQTV